MPFKSKAQRKKYYELSKIGKISEETLKKLEKESEGLELPEKMPSKVKAPKPPKNKAWFAKVHK